MSVNLFRVFSAGLKDNWKNPVLFVPNFLSSVLSLVLFLLLFTAATMFFLKDTLDFSNGFEFIMPQNPTETSFIIYGITFLIYGIIAGLISLYVKAGLIGMSHEAAEIEKTRFSTFFSRGNKYFFRFVSASVLMSLIFLLPISISTLILFLIYSLSLLISSSVVFVLLSFAAFVLLFFFLVFFLVFSVYLHFVFYSIVIDNFSAVAAIRKSIALFNENKRIVLFFLAVVFFISILFGILSLIFSLLSTLPTIGVIFFVLRLLLKLFKYTFWGTMDTVLGTRMYSALTADVVEAKINE